MSANTFNNVALRLQATDRLFMAAVVTLMFIISGLTLTFTNDASADQASAQAPVSAR